MSHSPSIPRPLWRRIVTNLTFWVLIAVISGVLLGHYAPATAVKMDILGNTFVQIIKWFIGPVIFLTIVLGIAGMESLGKVGRIGLKAIIYFEVVTTLALVIGVAVAHVINRGASTRPAWWRRTAASIPNIPPRASTGANSS
jgi:aerobic C4-dicarboxylate transport protein